MSSNNNITSYGYLVVNYVNGLKQGFYKRYQSIDKLDENVLLESYYSDLLLPIETGFYKDDRLDGEVITYYNNGNILTKRCFSNGKIHGVYRRYDYEGGRLLQFVEYVNGGKTGYSYHNRGEYSIIEELFYL